MTSQFSLKIATWNVNGIKARLETLLNWLREANADVVCLQEIKTVAEGFPREPFEELGYNIAMAGQKSFNGVAILSKAPLEDVIDRLPGDADDEQARYLEATIPFGQGVVRVATIYLPNGNPINTGKFDYKLAWMKRLEAHARTLLTHEIPVVLAGDYNVIPEPQDAKAPENWLGDALYQPESRDALSALMALGFTDALRATTTAPATFTFWDYQAGAWQKNNGIRIDHILLSAQAADRLSTAGIDRHVRGWESPSDHVPVWITLEAQGP
ncbi:MAG: exodeoxyribonuclease III [Hyphomicrobiaceae bacterium]